MVRWLRDALLRLLGHTTEPTATSTTYTTEAGLICLTSAPGQPDDVVAEEQHQFILDHWPQLGAAAFQGFRRLGAGCIVLRPATESRDDIEHPFSLHQLAYAPARSAWLRAMTSPPVHAWLDERLEHYDVRGSAVVVFARGTEPHRGYHVEATLSPPEALERMRASHN